MKRISAALAVSVMASSALAGTINMDGRFDYLTKTYNDDAGGGSNSTFTFNIIRLDYKGQINDTTNMRLRARLDKAAASQKRDTVGPQLDMAYIQKKFSDNLTVTAGKISSEIGGFEGQTQSPELYLRSGSYLGTSGISGQSLITNSDTTNKRGTISYLYAAGVKAAIQTGPIETVLMAFNPNSDADNDKNTNTFAGAIVRGSFLDKTLKVALSYHNEDEAKSSADNVKSTALSSASVQYTYNDIILTADLLKTEVTHNDTDSTKDSITSNVITVAYKMDEWTPMVKYYSSEGEDKTIGATTTLKNKETGMSLAVEYKPVSEENFRYHLVYNNVEFKGDGQTKTPTTSDIIAGIRFNADFLK